MPDSVRSRIMRAVPRSDSKPELAVRQILHRLGFRFRLHRADLPGTPDIVLPRYKTVVFVHGCFWHRHEGCKKATTPKTNAAFWQSKFEQNRERDERNVRSLRRDGWRVLIVWECEATAQVGLAKRFRKLLHEPAVAFRAPAGSRRATSG